MEVIICRLCRARIAVNISPEVMEKLKDPATRRALEDPEREDGVCQELGIDKVRCPKCSGVQKRVQVAQGLLNPPPRQLGCRHCLCLFPDVPQISNLSVDIPADAALCPACGELSEREKAAAFATAFSGFEEEAKTRLLKEGVSCSGSLLSALEDMGAEGEAADKFCDRLLNELPFARWQSLRPEKSSPDQASASKGKAKVPLLKFAELPVKHDCCDACGLKTPAEKLTWYQTSWVLGDDGLKRYSKDFAGYEGEFAQKRFYNRHCLYLLCPKCAKNIKKPDFANGFPASMGYVPQNVRAVRAKKSFWDIFRLLLVMSLALLALCGASPESGRFVCAPARADRLISVQAAPGYKVSRGRTSCLQLTYASGSPESPNRLKVKGLLFTPQPVPTALPQADEQAAQVWPLAVFSHDGCSGISRSHQKRCAELAGALGVCVLAPSFRGEDASEGTVEIAKGEVDDVLQGVLALRRLPYADTGNVVFLGASHGALVSLLAAGRCPDSIGLKGLVFAYGVADIYSWWDYLVSHGKLGKDPITRRTYGDGPQDRPQSFALRHGLNALPGLAQRGLPLLIIQGALDDITPPEQARILERESRRQGIATELHVYPAALHGFLVYAPYLSSDVTRDEKEQAASAWQTTLSFCRRALSGT